MSMELKINSSLSVNSVVFICADREQESGQSRRLNDDLSVLALNKFLFEFYEVNSADEFWEVIREINIKSLNGMLPIIHFHMHGSKEKGLEIGKTGEYISWELLINELRKININTSNNLCVISSACYALYMIKPISVLKETPFFILIAPEDKVSFGFIDNKMSSFYSTLFMTSSIDESYKHIQDVFKYFHSERLLVISMAKYIKKYCCGKVKNERKEELLTEALLSGITEDKKKIRKEIAVHINPNEYLLKKYSDRFIFNRSPSVSMQDILRFVKGENA